MNPTHYIAPNGSVLDIEVGAISNTKCSNSNNSSKGTLP